MTSVAGVVCAAVTAVTSPPRPRSRTLLPISRASATLRSVSRTHNHGRRSSSLSQSNPCCSWAPTGGTGVCAGSRNSLVTIPPCNRLPPRRGSRLPPTGAIHCPTHLYLGASRLHPLQPWSSTLRSMRPRRRVSAPQDLRRGAPRSGSAHGTRKTYTLLVLRPARELAARITPEAAAGWGLGRCSSWTVKP